MGNGDTEKIKIIMKYGDLKKYEKKTDPEIAENLPNEVISQVISQIDVTKYQGLSKNEILDKFRKKILPEMIEKIHGMPKDEDLNRPCIIWGYSFR